MVMVKAELVYHDKAFLDDGLIVEMTIWRLQIRTTERPHALKYSLFFGRSGERIVGYDNERGKGDHRHYRNREEAYRFTTIEALVADFLADVATARGDAE
jgi:Family of unknown function (DUF6516)